MSNSIDLWCRIISTTNSRPANNSKASEMPRWNRAISDSSQESGLCSISHEARDPSARRNNLQDKKIRNDREDENKRQVHGGRRPNLRKRLEP
jgi:hypothetical protein